MPGPDDDPSSDNPRFSDPLSDPFSEASLQVHSADRNYPDESRYAAQSFLTGRRGITWSLVAVGVLLVALGVETAIGPNHVTIAAAITEGLLLATFFVAGKFVQQMFSARSWILSLRRMMGIYTVLPVSTTRYARATLAGEPAASALETALITLWHPADHTEAELTEARQILARQGLPDVSSEDYELRPDTPFPWWNRHGIRAHEAPLPDLDHQCQPWAVAVMHAGTEKAQVALRCPCDGQNSCEGGRYNPNSWIGRNRRRDRGDVSSSAE